MDQNCSQSPNREVERSPSKPPIVEFEEVGKVSPNDRAESPDTNCAICLGKLQNKSFTDSCLHQFCFTCLLEWSKVKAECPLCKQSFKSIIHNVRSIEDYDQYHLRPSEQRLPIPVQTINLSLATFSDDNPRFRYRTTMVPGQPLYGYLQRLEHMMSHGEIIPPGYISHNHHNHHRRSSWRSHALPTGSGNSGSRRPRLMSPDYFESAVPGTSGFRRHIYNNNLWVRRVPDLTGRFRECSAEFFLNNPAQVHRLVPWLNRELNVLLHGTEHETVSVVGNILDLLPRYNIRSQEFRNALFPYIGQRTDHFIHEFYAFGTSPYDMVGYDRICLYGPRFQFSDNDLSDSSSDSDVQIVEVVRSDSAAVNVPSQSVSRSREVSPTAGPSHSLANQDTLIALSSEDESNSSDCQIVGSVKPRHLRTPEVIDLDDNSNSSSRPFNTNLEEQHLSEESDVEVDRKPIIYNRNSVSDESSRTMMSRLYHVFSRRSHSFCLSSSEESSGEKWTMPQKKSVKMCKTKKGRSEGTKKKAKTREPSTKKKISKEKKLKPVKQHWKKKLCRKIESTSCSSSDEGPVLPNNTKKRKFVSSSSDESTKIDHDYASSYSKINKRRGHSSRLKSVVHVKRNNQENCDKPLRNGDRGPSISSVTSSRCSTSYSAPSTSSYNSSNYTAHMIPNGSYSARILLRRNRLRTSSESSSSSTLSSSSSTSLSPTSYSSSHKSRHRKVKSKRKHT